MTRHFPARLMTSLPLSGRFMRIGVETVPSPTVPVTLCCPANRTSADEPDRIYRKLGVGSRAELVVRMSVGMPQALSS